MNKFEERKYEFLDFWLSNGESKINHIEAYRNNIEKFELAKDKDLKDFTKDEVKEVIGKERRTRTGIRSVTETFVVEYIKWCKSVEKEQKREQKRLEKEKTKQEKENLKKEIKVKMQKYVDQKEVFIEEFHSDKTKGTKETYIGCYKSNIAPIEVYKNKDLLDFIEDDIREVFTSMSTTKISVKRMLYSFIQDYITWTDGKGMNPTHYDVLQGLDKEELFALNLKAFKKQFLTLDETYNICEKAIENKSSYQDCIVLLLARYGVEGNGLEDLLNVKWEDVDSERNKIRIVDITTGEIRELDIDKRLVEWIDKAKECNVYNNGVVKDMGEKYYYDNGYIVKTQIKDNSGKETARLIYRRVAILCRRVGINNIQLKNLVSSREFDLINKIREIKDELTASDFLYVHKLFYPYGADSSYFFLMEKYELYYGVKAISYSEDTKREKKKVEWIIEDNEDENETKA